MCIDDSPEGLVVCALTSYPHIIHVCNENTYLLLRSYIALLAQSILFVRCALVQLIYYEPQSFVCWCEL